MSHDFAALYSVAYMSGIGCAVSRRAEIGELDGSVIHPGDTFGRICWWLWQQSGQSAVDVCAAFVRELARGSYGFDSVLESVVAGLPQALPSGADPDQVEALLIRIRAEARDQP